MTVKSENLKNFELESLLLLREMVEIKKKIQSILTKFNVTSLDQIEDLIEQNKLPEHPTYEEYLAALSLQQTLLDLKKQTESPR